MSPSTADFLVSDHPPRPEPELIGAWLRKRMLSGDRALERELGLIRRSAEGARRALQLVHRELPSNVDPHDLAKAGWGVIFPRKLRKKLAGPLRPLLDYRKHQAVSCFHELDQHEESAAIFLARHGERPGTLRPDRMPYYLLIVGSPEDIPWEFQYHLGLSHAVGRVASTDPGDLQRYAEAVRDAEQGGVPRPPQVVIHAPEHDETTRLLGERLVGPLHDFLARDFGDEWALDVWQRERATRDRLLGLLGAAAPGLLLIAGHGLRCQVGAAQQEARQGAICCQPGIDGEPENLVASDLAALDVFGLISFCFSCFGAGTPQFDDFPHAGLEPEAALKSKPKLLSPRPFMARLPQELLRRRALAFVGHVDRGWTSSFFWDDVESLASLEDGLRRLLRGHRLGHALRPLHRRYAQLAARLSGMLDTVRRGVEPSESGLRNLGLHWTAVNDARNIVVIGDPAVYLLGKRRSEAMFQLEPDLLHRASQRAQARQESVEAWIHRVLHEHLR